VREADVREAQRAEADEKEADVSGAEHISKSSARHFHERNGRARLA
jgi:hypothetical protein